MSGTADEVHSRQSRGLHPLSSIRARILAGIGLVLVLLVVVSVRVWQASGELERALEADAASQRSAQQGGTARTALVELRLGVADYLRIGGIAEKDALEGAMSRLEQAARAAGEDKAARAAQARVALVVRVRAELPPVSEAIELRRAAAGLLDDAAAVLGNSATTLAETAFRTGDRSLSEPAAALLSAVSRSVAASSRFSASDDDTSAGIAMSEAARAKALLDGFLNVASSPPRIQRLSLVTAGALDALTAAAGQLHIAVQRRGERLAGFSALSDRLAAAAERAALAIAAERQQRRAETAQAQAKLRATVIWATVAACLIGLSIAIGLILSITRSTRRLAAAMESIGAGTLDLALPDGDSSELGQLFAAAEVMRARVQAMVETEAEERRSAQNLLIDALEGSGEGIVLVDSAGHLVAVNSQMARFYPSAAYLLQAGSSFGAFAAAVGGAAQLDAIVDGATELPLGGGRWVRISRSATQTGGFVAITSDITALKQREAELRQTNGRFDAALTSMSQGLCLYSDAGRLLVVNQRFHEIYGLRPERVAAGCSFRDVLEAMQSAGHLPAGACVDTLSAAWSARLAQRRGGSMLQAIGGGRKVAISYEPTAEGGWVATYDDVTERQRVEEQAVFLARHDALTRLPNRVLFRERIEQALAQVGRGAQAAVLCLDLDRFKAVNDTLGHPVGDSLLQAVADRLQACVRDVDTVARLGGDEFAVVQVGLDPLEGAELLACRLVDVLSRPYDLDGHSVVIGTSVGVALAPHDGTHPDTLLKNADTALYRAKQEGRGTHRFFEREMDTRLQARRAFELDLRSALVAGEFELFYQPLMDLTSTRICGFEALMRWRHPTRGLVSPAEFIPVAEEIGLIVPMGEWVLNQACTEAAGWPEGIKVAVNLSPVQFQSGALLHAVTGALHRSGLPARRLELEITESVLLQNNKATLATLHDLRGLGVRIAMDDFGTGYSSLSYLRSFPFDKIKIDQSFVRDLCAKPDSAAIIRAVTGLGASLGMTTTAEGVETHAQLARLRNECCTEVQGYLLSRPCPAGEVAGLLRRSLDENWLYPCKDKAMAT